MTIDKILNLSEEQIKELEVLIKCQQAYLGIFNKGIELCKGLNDLEKSLEKKLDDVPQESA